VVWFLRDSFIHYSLPVYPDAIQPILAAPTKMDQLFLDRPYEAYAGSFLPNCRLTGPGGSRARAGAKDAKTPLIQGEFGSRLAQRGGQETQILGYAMPSSALITMAAMPTGIMIFHPMFMSWS